MRRFAVFDIDGTLFRGQLVHEVMFECAKRGDLPPAFTQAIRPAWLAWQKRAHRVAYATYQAEFDAAVSRFAPELSHQHLLTATEHVLQRAGSQVYAYTRDLADSLRRDGYILLAISGSLEAVVGPFAQKYGFDHWVGARHTARHGSVRLIDWPNLSNKGHILRQLVHEHHLTWRESIGVGDTTTDIPMLELVDHAIAFNPNQALLDHAAAQGWKVIVERKDVYYELAPHQDHYRAHWDKSA